VGRITVKLNGPLFSVKAEPEQLGLPGGMDRVIHRLELAGISTSRDAIDPTVNGKDIKSAPLLSAGIVVGFMSTDRRRLRTVRLTEGDVTAIKRVLFGNDNS
jgi:hypothetical protein